MRSIIKALLTTLGLDLVRQDPTKVWVDKVDTPHGRRASFMQSLGIDVALDVGAHKGWYAADLRAFGYGGKIVSFEPQTVPYKELEARATRDPRWTTVQCALGDEDTTTTLHISQEKESSSLLDILPRHVEALPGSEVVGSEEIKVARLDGVLPKYAGSGDKVFLKMDVQGFEKQVLAGASGCLGQVFGIQMEMSLKPLYQGEALFAELLAQMDALGFHLAWVEPGFQDGKTGELLQLDGIFVRHTNP